ncbi:MAG: TldD/PmbA family protein [Deltaproteobacteria bacterium]|nr:TldD/PmbA family protein [Deltaproteobacteria bacterium]
MSGKSVNSKALALADRTLDLLKKAGVHQALCSVRLSRSVETQARDGKIEKLQEAQSASLTVHLYVDGRYAAHNTSDLRPAELQAFLADAVALTRMLDPDPDRSLPEASRAAKSTDALALFDPAYPKIDADTRKRLVLEVDAASRVDKQVISATANFSDEDTDWAIAASNGTRASQRATSYSLGTEVTVGDGDKRPEDWWYVGARTLAGLQKPAEIGAEATRRAIARVGAKKDPSGKFTLVIENRAAGRLVSHWLQALLGGNLQQKRSFLDGKLGANIASPLLTLRDEPSLAVSMGARSFDREGMAAKPLALVEQGVLKNYYLDWYYAQKLKMAATTGSLSTLSLPGGSGDLAKLMAGIDRGILVTSFNGGNSNSLTGDFSLGIQGRRIEKGALAGPLTEMNLTGNHTTFWQTLRGVGGDPYPHSSLRMPSLVFEGAAVAGS